jgi:hypothetical protein
MPARPYEAAGSVCGISGEACFGGGRPDVGAVVRMTEAQPASSSELWQLELRLQTMDQLMAAHAGKIAQKSRYFRCARCPEDVSARAGEPIPPCPNGHLKFKSRMQQAGHHRS